MRIASLWRGRMLLARIVPDPAISSDIIRALLELSGNWAVLWIIMDQWLFVSHIPKDVKTRAALRSLNCNLTHSDSSLQNRTIPFTHFRDMTIFQKKATVHQLTLPINMDVPTDRKKFDSICLIKTLLLNSLTGHSSRVIVPCSRRQW